MIGRSLIVFQLGDDKNELHETDSWGLSLASANEAELDKKIVEMAKKKRWRPEEVVSDAELVAIVNATNCGYPNEPGYHVWASDGVRVINCSGDPSLPNPAHERRQRKWLEQQEHARKLKQLEPYIPELVKLRDAIPTGKIRVSVVLSVDIEISPRYWAWDNSIKVFDKDGEHQDFASRLIDREELAKRPDLQHLVNCPHRLAFEQRCQELADVFGLTRQGVSNELARNSLMCSG